MFHEETQSSIREQEMDEIFFVLVYTTFSTGEMRRIPLSLGLFFSATVPLHFEDIFREFTSCLLFAHAQIETTFATS